MSGARDSRPTVTLVYNTTLYVLKFRLNLIAALQAAGYRVVVISPPDGHEASLSAAGIEHRPIAMSAHGMNPLAELRMIWRLRAILRAERPLVSLHFTIKPNLFGTIAAALAGVPAICNVAGAGLAFIDRSAPLRLLVSGLYRRAFRRAARVFFQNRDDLAMFREGGMVSEAKARLIPGSGVDLAHHRAEPQPEAGPLLYVGRMMESKGALDFLKAAAIAAERRPGIRFEAVGELEEGWPFLDRAEIERHLRAPQIRYLGAVAPAEMPALLARAKAVVLPSHREGVPRSLLEACATARPIITTDAVGCREVVEPGVNGFQVAVGDTEALAEAMLALDRMDGAAREAMGARGREKVEREFDERIVIAAYLEEVAAIGAPAPAPAAPAEGVAP